MMVPVSLAVARSVPSLLRQRQDSGERCASMTLTALIVTVSKMRTRPVVGNTYADCGGAWAGLRAASFSSRGSGRGYARKQFSELGDSAHIASGFGLVCIVCSKLMLLIS